MIRPYGGYRTTRAYASTFLFGRSGAAKEATLPSVAKSCETIPVPTIVIVFRRAVGLSATMIFGIHCRWAYRIRPMPKIISAAIPNARSSDRHPRFAAKNHIPSSGLFPAPRFPRIRTLSRWLAIASPPATDMQPPTRLTSENETYSIIKKNSKRY